MVMMNKNDHRDDSIDEDDHDDGNYNSFS